MSVEIMPTEPARYRFMREVLKLMIALRPREMREAAEELKRTMQAQIDPKTGRWRNETQANMHYKVSFPSIFMHVLRPLMKRFLPGEPPFAQDDSDLHWLHREFPQLVGGPGFAEAAEAEKKDHRPRTQLWTDGKGKE